MEECKGKSPEANEREELKVCWKMESKEEMPDYEPREEILQLFRDFFARVTNFEELVGLGSMSLTGFQQGLEFLRRPAINRTSELIEKVLKANETKGLNLYFEAGCINNHDAVQNISKLHEHIGNTLLSISFRGSSCSCSKEVHKCQRELCDYLEKTSIIVNDLEHILEDVSSVIATGISSMEESSCDGLDDQATANNKEEVTSSPRKPDITEYAMLMGTVYSMVKQDYTMQEKIIRALNLTSSSGELESYCLMWSLRPFINDEIMSRAWSLIP